MELSEIIPWGRTFQEYREMFLLTRDDLARTILGCADGPASFNAELTRIGGYVVSADPIYRFGREQIGRRIRDAYPLVMAQLAQKSSDYIWTTMGSIEALGQVRMEAMALFLADYDRGARQGRYRPASLPALPFADKCFDLALCSHYLFLYSRHLGFTDHTAAIRELCRVAHEVRIYPLLDLEGKMSRHLRPVLLFLAEEGMEVVVQKVGYQFQKGAAEMLVVKS